MSDTGIWDKLEKVIVMSDIFRIIYTVSTTLGTIGGVGALSNVNPILTQVCLYILVISIGAILVTLPKVIQGLVSKDNGSNVNNDKLIVEEATIKTNVSKTGRTHLREIRVRALEPVDCAIHHTRPHVNGPDLIFEVLEGGTLQGPVQVGGAQKIVVDFERTLNKDDTHTYRLLYHADDPDQRLLTYHGQRFSDFYDCERIVWRVQFNEKPSLIQHYVHDSEIETKVEPEERVALKERQSVTWDPKNILSPPIHVDIMQESEVYLKPQYVYDWKW